MGAEHNDSKSYFKIEISEKKMRRICVFLMETWRRRPPAAFKLGGCSRGTFPECSFGYTQPNLANQRPPFRIRLLLLSLG